jgi:hypothetical protein
MARTARQREWPEPLADRDRYMRNGFYTLMVWAVIDQVCRWGVDLWGWDTVWRVATRIIGLLLIVVLVTGTVVITWHDHRIRG